MNGSFEAEFDYVIVGGGSAGCVLAARLSEDASNEVLLIEAGGRDWNPFILVPAGIKQIGRSYDWNYVTEKDNSRNGVADVWPAGKVLGGGSSVNGMVWVRGQPADYTEWERMGATGWGYDDVLPYFIRSERYEIPDSPNRGYSGPTWVGPVRVDHFTTQTFLAAAQDAGYPYNHDYNSGDQFGATRIQVNQRRGWRWSTARAYLAPAMRRANLAVRVHATVNRVTISRGRATGVEYRDPKNGVHTVRARKEVLLTAGALGTPKLLLLSGIGPEKALHARGVKVSQPSAEVGHNLQEHPLTAFLHRVNLRTLNRELNLRGMTKHGFDFVAHGRGAVTSPATHAMVFMRDDSGRTNIQSFFAPFGVVSERNGAGYDVHAVKLLREFSTTGYACLLHPRSRGRVELRSSQPDQPPVITHSLLGDQTDVDGLRDAARRTQDIFRQPQFARLVIEEMKPASSVKTDDEWNEYLARNTIGARHPVGTARMGEDDGAPVDTCLRVRGVEGLRVADASVMPTLPSGNTNAPTVMIAERAAELIRRP